MADESVRGGAASECVVSEGVVADESVRCGAAGDDFDCEGTFLNECSGDGFYMQAEKVVPRRSTGNGLRAVGSLLNDDPDSVVASFPANVVRVRRDEIRTLINNAFESGFEGLNDDGLGMSGEDEKWLEIVENGCRLVRGHYEVPLPDEK